jgi:hypothetical protein
MEDRELNIMVEPNVAVEAKVADKRNYFTVTNIETLAKYYRDEDFPDLLTRICSSDFCLE